MHSWNLYFVYFALGLTTSLNIFSIMKDIQSYNLSIAETSFVRVPPFIPWCIKCFFADICQRITKKRKPFMVIGNFLAAVTCWLLLLDNLRFDEFEILLVLLQVFIIVADVNYDALMLLFTQSEDKLKKGRVQTIIDYWREIGTTIGIIVGAPLWGAIGSKGIYGILSSFYIISTIVCICMIEDSNFETTVITPETTTTSIKVIELDENGNSINTNVAEKKDNMHNCAYTLGNLHQAWLHPILRPLLIFTIVTALFPSPSTPMFYFMNDQLKYTPFEMSIRAACSQFASILAVIISYKFARFVPIRILFACCILFKISLGLMPLLLIQTFPKETTCGNELRNVTHWKNDTCYQFELLNLNPLAISCTSDAFEDAVDTFTMFPLKRIATIICSTMVEVTVYSFLLSLLNITGALKGVVDYFFISRFGIDHGKYGSLTSFTIFCSVLDLLSLCFVPLLPNVCVQDISADVERQKNVKELLTGEFSSLTTKKEKTVEEFVI